MASPKLWSKIRASAQKKHSGTVAVAAAVVIGMWYTYALGYTPEPPMLVMSAASVLAAWALNQLTPDSNKNDDAQPKTKMQNGEARGG